MRGIWAIWPAPPCHTLGFSPLKRKFKVFCPLWTLVRFQQHLVAQFDPSIRTLLSISAFRLDCGIDIFYCDNLFGQWGIIALPEYGSRWIYPWMAMRLRNDRSLIDFQFFFHRFAATIQSLLRSRCHLVLAITLWRIEQSDLRRSQVRNNKYSRQILLLGGMVRFTFDRIDEIPVWGQLPVIIWPIVWQYCQLQVSPQ